MSRKHYEATAELIATTSIENDAREAFALGMARIFAADNDRFDSDRFFEAACVSGEGYTS